MVENGLLFAQRAHSARYAPIVKTQVPHGRDEVLLCHFSKSQVGKTVPLYTVSLSTKRSDYDCTQNVVGNLTIPFYCTFGGETSSISKQQ